jgi:PAS domain S-box-containing protein
MVYVNRAFERQTGLRRDEILGQPLQELLGGGAPDPGSDEQCESQTWLERCLAPGQEIRVAFNLPDGLSREGWLQRTPGENGCEGVLGVVRAASRRSQIEETFDAVVDSALQALLIFQDDLIAFANKTATEMLGYSHVELLGMPFDEIEEIVHPEEREMVWGRFYARKAGEDVPPHYDFRIVRRDGTVIWVDMHASRIQYRGRPAIQAAMVDITERKAREREHEVIARVATVLRIARTRSEMLPIILDEVMQLLDADGAMVAMVDPGGGVALELGRGLWSCATGDRIPAGSGLSALVIESGESFLSNDAVADCRFGRPDLLRITRSLGGAPLIDDDETIGVLWVGRSTAMTPEDLRLLGVIAEMMATAIQRTTLIEELELSHAELELAYDATLEGWSRALELRDRETVGHTRRVSAASVHLARHLGLPESEILHLRRGAILHDIGKVGIPDSILLKPSCLTEEEWTVMRRHPVYAYEMLQHIPYLRPALDIPWCHHERWDGSGYPRGLRGEEIPLAARIFSVVDVWDALRSERPYRRAWSSKEVLSHLRAGSGTLFDPRIVDAFLEIAGSLNRRLAR